MPPPRLAVKPKLKPKRATVKKDKENGAIIRDISARRAAQEVSDSQSVICPDKQNDLKKSDKKKGSKVAERSGGQDTTPKKISPRITANVKRGKQLLLDDINTHKLLMTKLSVFSDRNLITRSEIVTLNDIAGIYTELNDVEAKLVRNLKSYLNSANVTEEEAETCDDLIKPSQIESLLGQSGKVIDDSLEKFKRIKQQYPNSPKVIQYLDFVDPLVSADLSRKSNSSKGSKSDSASSTGGIESLRKKILKSKTDFDKKFADIQKQYDVVKAKKDLSSFQSLKRQLEKLENKSSNSFERFSDKLEIQAEATDDDVSSFEDYAIAFSTQIESLLEIINKHIDSMQEVVSSKKSDYSTFFKKQDPPRFKGDCIDYMEWKKRWASQVSSHHPPDDFEIDLLKRHLPEEGRKKLFGCDSLTTAWRLLDKMYGDPKLIIQKLKSKLRNLKPKSKEPHEVVIEIADEVEYLVKRLRLLGATSVLSIDVDFLNSIYKNLTELHRQKWDNYD